MDSLIYTHPQKHYFKIICKFLYYFGVGDCWYEETERSKIHKLLYKMWILLANVYIYFVLLNVFLAHFRTDLNDKEKTDLFQFSLAHPSICSKIIALYVKKEQITVVLKRFLEGTRSTYHSLDLETQSVKLFMKYFVTFIFASLLTMASSTADAVWTHVQEGIPIRTVVTFYPRSSNCGIFVNILRFLIEFHWWFIVFIMILIDTLAFGSLIFLGFKFKVLQSYFNNLRVQYLESKKLNSTHGAIEEEFRKSFITGIKLHEDAMWCARNIQKSMCHFYSVQVFECVALIVMCLVKLVVNDRSLTFLLANSVYLSCLILLTAIYMMAAGDVTYEASLVSTAIFHCGWELNRHRDISVLTVVALQQSQAPVHMTAFGVITLSYNNFISVLRFSYSFFAVMY